MNIHVLLNAVTANTTGAAIPVRRSDGSAIPVQVQGCSDATVTIEGTITEDVATATWSPIHNGEWSSDSCDALFANFSFVRAVVSNYVAGTITVKMLM